MVEMHCPIEERLLKSPTRSRLGTGLRPKRRSYRVSVRSRVWICLGLLVGSIASLCAEQFGPFTYRADGGELTITGYTAVGAGEVEIPAEIDGWRVTGIGESAFEGTTGLTSVSIPDGVTTIGGVAFALCPNLTTVSIPESVTTIGNWAFSGCSRLSAVVFLGGAPSTFSMFAFQGTATDFTIYYTGRGTGFTSPTWNRYPAIGVDPALRPSISLVSLMPAETRLTIPLSLGTVGRNIGVEYSPDMSPGSWIDLGNFFSDGSSWQFIDRDAVRQARRTAFYRAFLRPEQP